MKDVTITAARMFEMEDEWALSNHVSSHPQSVFIEDADFWKLILHFEHWVPAKTMPE